MNPPKEVEQLVERFERNKEEATSGNYNEMQIRCEFVDPFFYALGWDIENRQGRRTAIRTPRLHQACCTRTI